jgi:hypothetical protein
LYDFMETNEDMALLIVKGPFRMWRVTKEECQDSSACGKPMNNNFLCWIYSLTNVGDCWLSNWGRKNLQHYKYLHKPKMQLVGHG